MRAGDIFGELWSSKSHVWQEMVDKITSSTRPKIEAVYFCIVLVQMELHAGGNQGGDEKQLIDLERP